MRIVCPDCFAAYEVPDSLLGAGQRALRCVRCGREWVPETSPPHAAPESAGRQPGLAERAAARQPAVLLRPEPRASTHVPVAPPPPADSLLTAFSPLIDRPERAAERAASLAWLASVALLILLGAAAYVWRAEVQAAWPPSQRAYAALGLR